MAPDIGKIKSNISLMADQGATEEEIDIYVASEGTSAAELSAAPSAAPAPVERPTNDVLQEMMLNKRPLNEIEDFLKASRVDPTGMMGAVQANMDFMAKNPDFKGERPNIALPQMNPAAKTEAQEAASRMMARPAAILDGIIPNLGANVAGVGSVMGNALAAPFSDEVDFDPSGAFQQGYDASKTSSDSFAEEDPLASGIGNATGFGLGFAAPATKLMQGGRVTQGALKSGIVNGTATGAGYGLLAGLLNPTGAGRIENGAYGAGGGAALGAVAAPLIRGVTGAGQWLSQVAPPLDKMTTNIQATIARLRGEAPEVPRSLRQAQRVIADGMRGSNISTGMGTNSGPMTAQSVTDEVTRRANQGMPAMPADLAEPMRRRTEVALRGLGPMATAARERLAARQANQGGRIRERVQEELGAAVDPIKAAQDIARKASDEAKPNYQQAYSEGVVITPEIQQAMQTPIFKQGLRQAYENIQNRGGNPQELGMFMDEAGELTLGSAPTLEAMDQVIRTIRGDVKRDAFGKAMTDTKTGAEQAAASNLDELLRTQNKPYDIAKSTFADDMAIRDAMVRGGDVGKMSGHEINAHVRNTPLHAQEAFMTGAGTATADKAVAVGQRPTADVSMAIRKDLGLSGAGQASSMGDNIKVTALDDMSGRPGMMSRLDDKLESEAQGFKTFNEAYGGSKTAEKLGIGEDIMAGVTRSFRDIIFANPLAAAGSLMSGMGNANLLKFSGEVQEQIAKILTETNPANVQEAFQAIEARAAKDNNFKDLLNRSGVQLSRMTSTALGGANGDPFVPQE